MLSSLTSPDGIALPLATRSCAHHHFLLGVLESTGLLFLGFFELILHIFNRCASDRILFHSLIDLLRHRFTLGLQVISLDLERRDLISFSHSLTQLTLECLSDKDSFIFLFLHQGHLLELLLMFGIQIGVLLLKSAHILQFRLDLVGNDSPRTFSFVVHVVKIVIVDLARSIFSLNFIGKLLELVIVVKGNNVTLDGLKDRAP